MDEMKRKKKKMKMMFHPEEEDYSSPEVSQYLLRKKTDR